ncbi:hypothetical protein ACFYNN_21455 [Streptomyces sp. NPDC006978]|uniref:hypothetical protein n=1 Tax=Streptomyces sp. NPDC006978 TaxID=3364769 RepID=UPI0036D0B8D8
MDPPAGAPLLARCDRDHVQAFRIGSTAWGLRFHLEEDRATAGTATAPGPEEAAPGELLAPAPHRDQLYARFDTLVGSPGGPARRRR